MIYLEYDNLDQVHHDFSRVLFNNYDQYKDDFTLLLEKKDFVSNIF